MRTPFVTVAGQQPVAERRAENADVERGLRVVRDVVEQDMLDAGRIAHEELIAEHAPGLPEGLLVSDHRNRGERIVVHRAKRGKEGQRLRRRFRPGKLGTKLGTSCRHGLCGGWPLSQFHIGYARASGGGHPLRRQTSDMDACRPPRRANTGESIGPREGRFGVKSGRPRRPTWGRSGRCSNAPRSRVMSSRRRNVDAGCTPASEDARGS